MKLSFSKIVLFGSIALLSACGSPSQTSPATSTNLNQGIIAPINTDSFKGFVNGGAYDNQQVLSVDLNKKEFQVSVPLGRNVALNLVDTPIAELPGSHAYTSVLADGSKVLVLAVPFKYSLKEFPKLPKGVLPSGDPLPGAVSGPQHSCGSQYFERPFAWYLLD